MRRLWAPWRTVYINEAPSKGCIFCRGHQARHDRKNLILHRGEEGFVLLNRFPYSNGHLMIAPFRHVGELSKLTCVEIFEMFDLLNRAIGAIRKTMRPQAFNVGLNLGRVAGAGVEDHVHIHVVPRWSGDTNFMPVLCQTKVISEALDCTYRKLKKVF